MSRHDALRRAVKEAGGQSALAARLGVRQSTVWSWLNEISRGVAAEYVLAIEEATGVSRHELRPDIYPPPGRSSCPDEGRVSA